MSVLDHRSTVLFLFAIASAVAPPVLAADSTTTAGQTGATSPSKGIEEILVTARRRTESVQDVPMSLSVLTGADLDERNVKSIQEAFTYTPNVTYEYSGYNTSSRVYIRGVGNAGAHFLTGDPTVALYVDGVYQARAATGIFDVLDLDRVEVLRGPQGTLFGRNSTGGAIQVITKNPQPTTSAEVTLGLGNDGYYDGTFIGNVPIADNLFLRGGISWQQRDGYQENQVDGSDWNNLRDFQARLAVRYEPTDAIKLDLVAHYTQMKQHTPLLRCMWDPAPTASGQALMTAFGVFNTFLAACNQANAAPADEGYSNLHGTYSGTNDVEFGGLTATATWEAGFGTITSITAWQTLDEKRDTEADGTSFGLFDVYGRPSGQHQYSQEFRLDASAFDKHLDYTVGVYAFTENAQANAINCLLNVPSPVLPPGLTIAQVIGGCTYNNQDLDGDSAAVFGEGTYHVTDRLDFSAGIRGNTETKKFGQLVANYFTGVASQNDSQQKEFNAWTPRFIASYAWSDDARVYASWSQGYKSGGFNGRNPLLSFSPETVEMSEVGLKSEWLDHRLQVNLAAFYGDYADMQLLVTRATAGGQFLIALTNAASSTVKGGEIELVALPFDGLTLGANFGYTDAEYDEFDNVDPATGISVDLSNNEFPSTPKYNYSLSADYRFAAGSIGTLSLHTDWADQTKTYNEIDNINSIAQENKELLNASINLDLPDGRTKVSVWGKNLLDSTYDVWGQTTRTSLGYNAYFYGPPRWYGIQFTYALGE